MRARSLTRPALSAALVLAVGAACEPTLSQETGVVVGIDSPALGRVDTFELVTADGERVVFDTTELEFRAEFPTSHLAEHRILGDTIVVTYRRDGDRLVVTQLDDGAH